MKNAICLLTVLTLAGWSHAAIQPIDGSNVVGFASVTVPASANTIVTVPFEACLTSGDPGSLADLVSTNGLIASDSDAAAADQLVVLTTNGTDLVYYYYWNKNGAGWTATDTMILLTNGTSMAVTPPDATNFPIARGLGFWIKRPAGSEATLYLKGQVSSAKQNTQINEGLNLVGIANVEAFGLNDSGIDWSGAYGTNALSSADKIIVCSSDGTVTTYYYYKNPNPSEYYAQFTNKWVESTSTGPALPTGTLSAGQGFWYWRRGNGSFVFRPDGQ